MERATNFALALAAIVLAAGDPATGQTREQGPWWPHPLWGPEDEAGGSNWITPEVVLRVARLVETETRRLNEPASSFTLQCEEYAKKRDVFMAFLTDAGLKPVKPAGGYTCLR